VQHAERAGDYAVVRLNWGQWTMEAGPGALTLRAEAADDADLQRILDMLTTRLQLFGRREHLKVEWHRPGQPSAELGQAR
jgi:hypothetical protein